MSGNNVIDSIVLIAFELRNVQCSMLHNDNCSFFKSILITVVKKTIIHDSIFHSTSLISNS